MNPQTGYFDIHCHILPQVDDGSDSMKMSLDMIHMEYDQGVRSIVLTPHYATGCKAAQHIRLRYEELKEAAAKIYPDLKLLLGNELFYSDAVIEELAEGKALTMAGTDYVLVEFDIGISWKAMQGAFRRLAEYGYRPILAHMERFSCLDGCTERIDQLISQGVCMQMNCSSVAGGYFDRKAAYCRRLIKSGRIHLLGTDAHKAGWRPPDMGQALQQLGRRLNDDQRLADLVFRNPARMLENAYIS